MTQEEKKYILRWYVFPFVMCSYGITVLCALSLYRELYIGQITLIPIIIWFLMRRLETVFYTMLIEHGVITVEDIDDVQ